MKIVLIIAIIASTFARLPLSTDSANYTWKSFANNACTSEIKDDLNIIPGEITLIRRKEDKIKYTVTYENKLIVVKSLGKSNSLICFSANDLSKLWTYDAQSIIDNPPICYNGNIYYYSYASKSITSVNLENGKKRSSVGVEYNMNRYPLNAFDGKIYYSSTKHLTCFNPVTLKKIWECKVENINDAFCVSDNKIIAPTTNYLYAINSLTGAIEWKVEIPGNLGTQTMIYRKVIYKVFDGDVRSYSVKDGSLITIHREENIWVMTVCNDNLILFKGDLGMKSLSLDFKNLNWYNKEVADAYLNTYPLAIDDKIFHVFLFRKLRSYRLAMIDGKDGKIIWVSQYGLQDNEINYASKKLFFYRSNGFIYSYTLSK